MQLQSDVIPLDERQGVSADASFEKSQKGAVVATPKSSDHEKLRVRVVEKQTHKNNNNDGRRHALRPSVSFGRVGVVCNLISDVMLHGACGSKNEACRKLMTDVKSMASFPLLESGTVRSCVSTLDMDL